MIRIFLGNPGCLPKGTLIHTPIGLRPIESCFHVLSMDQECRLIDSISSPRYSGLKQIYVISTDIGDIQCSAEHRWYILRNGMTKVIQTKNLNKGDILFRTYAAKPKAFKEQQLQGDRQRKDKVSLSQSGFIHDKDRINDGDRPSSDKKKAGMDGNKPERFQRTGKIRDTSEHPEIHKCIIRKEKSSISSWEKDRSETEQEGISESSKRASSMDMHVMWMQQYKDGSDCASQGWEHKEQSCDESDGAVPIVSCQITYVKKTGIKAEMYDLIVPGTNNFILSDGLISHNSGKTASYVRELYLNPMRRRTYSNIITTKIPWNVPINRDMLIKKEIVKTITRKTGETEPVYKISFNADFWKETIEKEKAINVCIDEAHTVLNARSSFSKTNKAMGDFMSLCRRILGSSESGYGELTFISQLDRRIDVIAREMATNIRYHRCHYLKTCRKCGLTLRETNDDPEPIFECPSCRSSRIYKHSHRIEVYHFSNIQAYSMWKDFGMRTYHRHYFINDIEDYFKFYKTLQWENLLSE